MTTEESKKHSTGSGRAVEGTAKDRLRDHQSSQNQPEHAGKNVSSNADEAQKKQDKDLEEGAENPV